MTKIIQIFFFLPQFLCFSVSLAVFLVFVHRVGKVTEIPRLKCHLIAPMNTKIIKIIQINSDLVHFIYLLTDHFIDAMVLFMSELIRNNQKVKQNA